TRSAAARPDGSADHRRPGGANLSATPTGHTAAVRPGRRAGRAAPPGSAAAQRRGVPAGTGGATVGPVPAATAALTAERVRPTRLISRDRRADAAHPRAVAPIRATEPRL